MPRRRVLLAAPAALAAAALTGRAVPALAQDGWPARPIRFVVPFPPGGSNDVFARAVGNKLVARLGQQVVVENRAGAAGVIGSHAVAQATPDGYTFMVHGGSFTTSAAVQRTPYDVIADFTPVAMIAKSPMVAIVPPASPARTLADLVRLGKARPGEMNYGSSGPGGVNHFATEWLNLVAGTRFEHVPYRGMAPAITDLAGGRLDFIITTIASAGGPLGGGQVRAIAVSGAERLRALPDVPTAREQGIDYIYETWWGVLAPRGLPAAIRERMNAAVVAASAEPDSVRRFEVEGASPVALSAEGFGAALREELERCRRIAREANIRIN